MKYILASVALMFSLTANAQFIQGMSVDKISNEVQIQTHNKVSLEAMVITADKVKISMTDLAGILIIQGHPAIDVIRTIVRLHPELAADVVKIAVSIVPELKDSIITTVLAIPKVDPASVLAASASGEKVSRSYDYRSALVLTPNSSGAVSPH